MTIGIYCIEHIESGKKYVGKSENIERRLTVHKRNLQHEEYRKECNFYLWRAVKKYGFHSFTLYTLKTFDVLDKEILADAELDFIDKFDTCNPEFGYNLIRSSHIHQEKSKELREYMSYIFSGSGNPFYGKRHTEAAMLRIIEANTGKNTPQNVRDILSEKLSGELNPFYGKHHTDYTKLKMSIRKSGDTYVGENNPFYGRTHTEETKKIIALNTASFFTKYYYDQYTLTKEFIKRWSTPYEASLELSINSDGIQDCARGKRKQFGGFLWVRQLKNTEEK